MATLHLRRAKSFLSSGSSFTLKLDDKPFVQIMNDAKLAIEVPAGSHVLQISTVGITSEKVSVIFSDDEPLYYETGINSGATFALYIMSLLTVFSFVPFIVIFGFTGIWLWIIFMIVLLVGIFFMLRNKHYYLIPISEAAYNGEGNK